MQRKKNFLGFIVLKIENNDDEMEREEVKHYLHSFLTP